MFTGGLNIKYLEKLFDFNRRREIVCRDGMIERLTLPIFQKRPNTTLELKMYGWRLLLGVPH